ncbi:hypothetical protein PV05_11653 [Exophiala xenobiotica]|uniref:Uncharacterized protein n=1 Tax=Exophiala xenobiotica TaxID=348802 RepID=A0A0D2EQM1_9EURO|nr:uncharacterized protein PV05_11653 [Exophiala xenobiotica]KIW50029.1 hypothetical protein PV05_11653 [Exophiala xenobiotica]
MAMAIPRRTPARLNTVTTYTLAHTAQCKLKLAANRPDRNLRFVLGHAFTLDNLMLRIVEIENSSAKSAFTEGKRSRSASGDEREHYDCTKPVEHFDCTAAAAPPPEPEHFDCTAAPPEPEQVPEDYDCTVATPVPAQPESTSKGRRISFQDNNARPSKTSTGTLIPGSPQGRRSPPPVENPLSFDDDSDEGTSSDDYDDPELAAYDCEAAPQVPEEKKMAKKARPVHDAYEDEEDAALELADDELDTDADADPDGEVMGLEEDMDGLGLTRFESASAKPPRMVQDLSDDEDEEEEGPESPPQLPADVDVRQIIEGEKDEELTDLYESVRRCMCHGQRDTVGGRPEGVWDVPEEKAGGRRLALVAVAA